jgi:AraC-like DNA-binding protein
MRFLTPAWNGQCLLTNGGWLFSGSTSRELKVCFPATQILISDQHSGVQYAKSLSAQTIPKGFSGQILVLDPASQLSRLMAQSPHARQLATMDNKESADLAQDCIDRRDIQPYLRYMGKIFDIKASPSTMLKRQYVGTRLGAVYDKFNASLDLLSASEAADMCGLSPSRFSWLFKQDLDMGFPDYMAFLKFRNYLFASRLTSRTQQMIAITAGFYDLSHASRAFQKSMSLKTYDLRGLRVRVDKSLELSQAAHQAIQEEAVNDFSMTNAVLMPAA